MARGELGVIDVYIIEIKDNKSLHFLVDKLHNLGIHTSKWSNKTHTIEELLSILRKASYLYVWKDYAYSYVTAPTTPSQAAATLRDNYHDLGDILYLGSLQNPTTLIYN